MENKINIAILLKNCPTGMELDSPMYDNLYFDKVEEDYRLPISCYTMYHGSKTSVFFTEFGSYNTHKTAKCVIFPKGKTTWEGFVPPCKFKDGDIVATKLGSVFILKNSLLANIYSCYVGLTYESKFIYKEQKFGHKSICRLATEKEKEKLFKAIKENGYEWNEKTKTLKKLVEPKFKVGDTIKSIGSDKYYIIKDIEFDRYILNNDCFLRFNDEHVFELVVEPKFKVGDRIRKKSDKTATFTISDIGNLCYYCGEYVICNICYQDDYELVPNKFDITTLKPFDKVLVRDSDEGRWDITFYELYDNTNRTYPYRTLGGNIYKRCIPYEGNEHLMGLVKDCGPYYKTWE